MSIETYLDHHVKLHTLRIELIDGKVLLYGIDPTVKDNLENWLKNNLDDFMEMHRLFLSFHTFSDRMVFIRITSIKRLIFCWSILDQVQDPFRYHDNFSVTFKDEEDLIIPELIVKMKNCDEPIIYEGLDPSADFLGIDEETFKNIHFLKGGFLKVEDEDGEDNYIPIANIDCIEAKRVLIYPEDMWQDMQVVKRQRSSEN